MTPTNNKLKVQDVEISLATIDNQDYISLTDMAKSKNDEARAANIIKNRSTLEFLGTWEILYNSNFKVVEFDHFKKEAGLPTSTISVLNWVKSTSEIY
ncbi:MAG: KilA-N domain-containing protein [Capnocytophaga gingivalis]|uniref:KilA-N domain-containing protein n=1 Tax=Capnocytophaga gingivalis TaxID=1017 RepID=UPI00362191FF